MHSSFAAANHDLRQPLQAMGIFPEMLKRWSTPQTLPIVEQFGRTSSTISTLVEQVLEVTRMEFGRLELHPEVIWLPELMEELSMTSQQLLPKRTQLSREVRAGGGVYGSALYSSARLKI